MKVYIIQSTRTLIIHGCFDTREKAEKFTNYSEHYFILEQEVA